MTSTTAPMDGDRPDGMTLGQATERLATLQREVADLQEQVKQLLTQRLENAAAQQVNRRTAHSKKKGTNAWRRRKNPSKSS